MIDTAKGYVRKAIDDTTFPHEASELVRDAERLGGYAYDMLQHMAGSDAEHIPHQIVAPFQRWADGLGIKNDLFFRADHVANYELRPVDLTELVKRINDPSQSLKDAAFDINWPFLRVTVPGQALGMLPHFAVVAHELGHAIQDQIIIDLSNHNKDDLTSIDRTKVRLETLGHKYGIAGQIQRQGIVSRWLNEFKADAVAHYLLGPAFYFAFGGFLELAGQGWGVGLSHPPSRIRRALMLDRLHVGAPNSFVDIFDARVGLKLQEETNSPHLTPLPDDDTLFNDLTPKVGVVPAAICVELVPLIRHLGNDVYDAVEEKLNAENPDMIYTPKRLADDLDCHLEELIELIPPIESREPTGKARATSLAGILNVGWAALLGKLDQIPVPLGQEEAADTSRMERLHELLLKAVELSEARQLWDEHQ